MKISDKDLKTIGTLCDLASIALIAYSKDFSYRFYNETSEKFIKLQGKDFKSIVKNLAGTDFDSFILNDGFYQKWNKLSVNVSKKDCFILIGNVFEETENVFQNVLDNEKEFLLQIIENTPQLLYWKDRNFVYRGCNTHSAEMVGFKSASDLIGKSDGDFDWDDERVSRLRKEDKLIIEKGISIEVEDEIPFEDDKKIFLTSKTPVRSPSGDIIGVLGISADITQLKQLEQALKSAKEAAEEANKSKTEFIANMSHDIRTPLTGVIGLSKMLERDISDPVQKEEAHLLAESGVQLLDMLNEVLEDVRAGNSNDIDILNEHFDLFATIDTLIKLEAPTTTAQSIALDRSISSDVPQFIYSDRRKITHILLNLLGNSIKFTKTGKVTIEVTVLDKKKSNLHLRFGVIDTGIGIPEVLQKKVFDRFFKAEASFKGVYSGYGLGLHIVKSYVNLLGGNITIASKEGYGTSVYFDLECEVGKKKLVDKAAAAQEIINVPKGSRKQCKVLLVEDNAVALKVLEDLIAKSNLESLSAVDGEQAFELVKANFFDFIVSDLGLPGMTGQELAQNIRAFEKDNLREPTPIFGLTAHVNTEIEKECVGFGMNGVFSKPVSQDNLVVMLEQVMPENKLQSPDAQLDKNSDLPVTDAELFSIGNVSVLDVDDALQVIGNDINLYNDILTSLVEDELPAELDAIAKAHANNDLAEVARLVHRLKSGISYVGAKKLSTACLYLERYYKSGQTNLFEKLYQQFLEVTAETVQALQEYLAKG